MAAATLAFPAVALPPWLRAGAPPPLSLRAAGRQDLAHLHDWYAESREAELAAVPWPAAAKRAFCDSQFALQHRHYTGQYVPASFLVVLHAGEPVGRLYLHWNAEELRIIDLLLCARLRGHGIGTALLRWLRATLPAPLALTLQVETRNHDAGRLYRRLGFEVTGASGDRLRMAWRASAGASVS